MKPRSISTCSATTGSPKLSWADMSDEDVDELGWDLLSPHQEDAIYPSHSENKELAAANYPLARSTTWGGPGAATGAFSATGAALRARAAAQRGAVTNRRTSHASRSWPTSPANGPAPALRTPAPMGGPCQTGPFSVKVENIPIGLCNDACIEAMLHQAGFHGCILGVELTKGTEMGTADIEVATWHAAVKCYNHFATSSWSTGALRVRMGESQKRRECQDAGHFAWQRGAEGGSAAGLQADGPLEASWATHGCYIAAVVPAFPFVQQGSQGYCIHPAGSVVPVSPSALGVLHA
mmetsp:Transcript_87660/g.253163  ORF Transcript_87660/g.253163 Transcript_87660/m.253163 type:complete len:294 (-) Transcript_87660:251-1132(-)